jgi:outer membrane receptor protein involved in Fe transport
MLFDWELGDWFASLNWDYIGSSESRFGDETWGSWNIFNVQAGYTFDNIGTFAVGANNVLDEDPILDAVGANVDEYTYDQTGRVIFVRYTAEF